MALHDRRQCKAQLRQDLLHLAAQSLGMLQGAGTMEGQRLLVGRGRETLSIIAGDLLAEYLDDIAGQGAYACGALSIVRVIGQHLAIFLDEGPAATGGLHDRFRTGLDGRPPGIDVGTHARATGLLGVEVIVDGTAAAGLVDRRDADAEARQHAGGGGIDVGGQARLHAALQHQHLARQQLIRRRRGDGRSWVLGLTVALAGQRDLVGQRARREGAKAHAKCQQGLEARGFDQRMAQATAQQALSPRAADATLQFLTPDIEQGVILHARRAGGLAAATAQAAIQMPLGLAGDLAGLLAGA